MDNKHQEKELNSSQSAVEDSEEEENEILEESPCGRWHKRREEVEQNNIPGIDATYLAMDTEEGVEVVWNEVRFSERKYFKAKEEIISEVFDRLIQLEHPNIVKLHKYWIHKDADIPKVVFITEYMSSGSLKQYFEKTKRHDIKISLQVWRRWCTQTLSALCYLHSSQPSIIHGNINCDTIFISYNGLIKIGAIAPDAIHRHVKTVRADAKTNLHFIAPELVNVHQDQCHCLTPAVDIYSFGMCALEMAALEIPTDTDSTNHISEDSIYKTIESLDISLQKDFIKQCLRKEPDFRPTARDLLFHPIIFEVPSLKLFCAHTILNNPSLQPEQLTEDAISRLLCLQNQNDRIVIEIKKKNKPSIIFKQSDFPNRELEKWLDEVKNGAFPLTAVMPTTRPPLVSRQRTISPEIIDDLHQNRLINTPDNPYDEETRRIVYMNCLLQSIQQSEQTLQTLPLAASFFDVKIVIKLDDKINRQLTCEISKDQLIPQNISQELVYYGFINKEDKENVAQLLIETLNKISKENNSSNSTNSNSNNSNITACCEKYFQQFPSQQQQQQLHYHQQQHQQQQQELSSSSNNNSPNNNHNNNHGFLVQTTKQQQQQPLINFEQHSVDNTNSNSNSNSNPNQNTGQQQQQELQEMMMVNHHQNGANNNNNNNGGNNNGDDNNDNVFLNDSQQQSTSTMKPTTTTTTTTETFPDSSSSSS